MELILDIETAGALSPEMEALLLEKIEANKSLKDPEKIKIDIETKMASIRDRAALRATRGKIIAVGLWQKDVEGWGISEVRQDEYAGLVKLWEYFDLHPGLTIITYNGFAFDLPYCIQRSRILGIHVPANINLYLNKYKDHHIDLMLLWTCGVYGEYVSMKELCIACGIDPPKGDGADIPRLYAEGKMDDIVEHCLDDLMATKELYERMT